MSTEPKAELQPGGRYRWTICALLFFVITINYVDRQVIGVLKPLIEKEMGWSEIDYANIVFSFQLSYAIGMVVVGRWLDWVGTRKGMAIAIGLWSLAAMFHAGARTVLQFMLARAALGVFETAAYPGSVKSVAEWFPRKERALGVGILNAGANIGVILTPIIGLWLASAYGWQSAFLATGALGLVVMVAWLLIYRSPQEHPKLSPQELAYITADHEPETKPAGWFTVIRHRQAWAFICAKFFTDPVWYLFLFWLPDLLKKKGMDIFPKAESGIFASIGPALVGVYLLADVGSIAGGWFSSHLLKRGWSVNAARKVTLLLAALCATPLFLVASSTNIGLIILLIGIGTAGHQAFSSNIFTTISDMYPRHAVATVAGLGGCAGAIGGMLIAKATGWSLEYLGSYLPVLIYASVAYLIGLTMIHILVPRLEPAPLAAKES